MTQRMPRPPQAHLRQDRPEVTPAADRWRAFPIGDPARPRKDPRAIVAYLDVESSPRYQPAPSRTYCNVYACDYCYLTGFYLPRVWWTDDALDAIAVGRRITPYYGRTVRELSANALNDWLEMFGPLFGWERTADLDRLQAAANAGQAALIVAKHSSPRRSGHVALVIPERLDAPALRRNEQVVLPLQSQAGRINRAVSTGASAWWRRDCYAAHGFWMNPLPGGLP